MRKKLKREDYQEVLLFSLIRLAKDFEFLKENERMRGDFVIKNTLNQKLSKMHKIHQSLKFHLQYIKLQEDVLGSKLWL
jgi:hypothetical protein